VGRISAVFVKRTPSKAPRRPPPGAAAPAKTPIAAAVEKALQAPAVLLAHQQAWVADRADVSVWEKSRRVGASWCDASDSVLEAGSEEGQDVLYIGYSEDMTREYIDDCAMWARAFNKAAGEVRETLFEDVGASGDIRHIKAFRIDFASGHKVLALSSRPRSIRGKQGKVTIDEAAFHDDLAGLVKAAAAMLIWGGRVRIISSHNGEDNAFNVLVKEIRAGKLPFSIHRTTFDDALNAGLFERVKLILGDKLKQKTREEWRAAIYAHYGDNAAEELDCIPSMGGGVYIPRPVVERCQRGPELCRVIRWSKPAEWMFNERRLEETKEWIADVLKPAVDSLPNELRTVKGRDFGRSGDLSVDRVLADLGGARWRAALTLELRGLPFDVQETIDTWLLENLPHLHHAKYDARGNGQQLAEAALLKYGPARIECVMASAKWYAENFPPYKGALEGQSCELPRDEDEIADHRRVVLKAGYPTMDEGKDKGADGKQRHGDRAVASVLAWAATRTEGQPPAGESVESAADQFLPEAMASRPRATMFRRAV
jgi:phage FluMu gp28-like protein